LSRDHQRRDRALFLLLAAVAIVAMLALALPWLRG
jgi:hypothetical protein